MTPEDFMCTKCGGQIYDTTLIREGICETCFISQQSEMDSGNGEVVHPAWVEEGDLEDSALEDSDMFDSELEDVAVLDIDKDDAEWDDESGEIEPEV